jgi:perosamine synthetase
MSWKIPLFKIFWDEEDVKAVTEAIKKGMFWATGPEVEEFEKEISGYLGVRYAVAFNSGTSALHAALMACGIKPGDEVVVPSFTFIATANASLFVRAKPVFADIENRTLGLDPEDVKKKITKKTKAIIPVHYGGIPCLVQELKEIAQDHEIVLIEDAAEAFGAEVENRKVGTFGELGIFSFCQNKVITTGEGGAVITDSERLHEKLMLIRSHGRKENQGYFYTPGKAEYVSLGYNFRLSSLHAALGISQLKKVKKIIKLRRRSADRLTKRLSSVSQIELPRALAGSSPVYQLYTIRVKAGQKTRDELMKHLARMGVMSKVFFHPVHQTPFYSKKLGYRVTLPCTEKVAGQVLSLPIYPSQSSEEIDYIANTVKAFFEEFG